MARGSKPGERRGGRKPGTPNKLTGEHKLTITEMAASYAPEALKVLATIMADEKAPAAARTVAANSLIDRGFGKPRQPVEHELDLSGLTDQQIDALAAALAAGRGAPAPAAQGAGGDRAPETLN